MENISLRYFLSSNQITQEEVEGIIYDTFLLSILEQIITQLKDRKTRIAILNELRGSENEMSLLVIEELVSKYTGCVLQKHELERIYKWLMAFFRKKSIRKKYGYSLRQKILIEQNHKCNICNCHIDHKNAELDHIIAWDFVGDELEDNLQMLCSLCNEKKGKSVTYLFKSLILKNKYNKGHEIYGNLHSEVESNYHNYI